ncbi:MAG TPA: protein kinase [Pyrinomonadaceae bacterium]|jgi:serine/threonine-protein kinase
MSETNWNKIVEIFEQAVELAPAGRAEFLNSACAGDDGLRREVEAMLAADEKAENFIETPAAADASLSLFDKDVSPNTQTVSLAGQKIGAYRIEKEIGRGGMGAVFLAERADGEFQRRVAVKIISRHLRNEFMIRRFRQERQILAALDHPNIARLYDGGTTDDGSPYLIMEYVEGETLLEYCDENRLTVRQRLELFEQICAAVEYAHRQNVLHRDIKPSNILVKPGGTAKLLDFGIAKLDSSSNELSRQTKEITVTGRWMMTPEYASPEQARGESLTAASDVYSLGVVLYKLVTGQPPYKFPSRAPHEIARVICEESPSSFVLRSAQENSTSQPGEQRANDEGRRTNNLEVIVLKALRKRADERFSTVAELAAEIKNYLAGDAVSAEIIPAVYDELSIDKPSQNSGSPLKTLAVLPLRQIHAGQTDAESEFLGVGLADALTTRLSNVRQIIVRPTSSVVQLAQKSADSLALGKQLAVDYVLEGRVARTETQIRVIVQLLKIVDNSVLWASQFDESEADIFALQDSISEKVVASLAPHLTEAEQQRLNLRGTQNAAAYEAYLRGRFHLLTYEAGGITESIRYFQEAARLDPNFALAHAGIAEYYNWMEVYSFLRPNECWTAAKAAARRAIELDPLLSEAYAALAFTVWGHDWDFAESERLYRRAVELNPNNPRAHEWFSFLLQTVGRNDEAIAEMKIAQRLDPRSASHCAAHHYVLHNARRYREAEEMLRRGLEIDPENILCNHGFGWSSPFLGHVEKGIEAARRAVETTNRVSIYLTTLGYDLAIGDRREEARKILREMDEREKRGEYFPQVYFAVIHAGLGELDAAFARLDKSAAERDHWMTTLLFDPRLDNLRADSRFVDYVEKIRPLHESENKLPVVVEAKKMQSIETSADKKPAAETQNAPIASRNAEGITLSWRLIAIVAISIAAILALVLLYMIADMM